MPFEAGEEWEAESLLDRRITMATLPMLPIPAQPDHVAGIAAGARAAMAPAAMPPSVQPPSAGSCEADGAERSGHVASGSPVVVHVEYLVRMHACARDHTCACPLCPLCACPLCACPLRACPYAPGHVRLPRCTHTHAHMHMCTCRCVGAAGAMTMPRGSPSETWEDAGHSCKSSCKSSCTHWEPLCM